MLRYIILLLSCLSLQACAQTVMFTAKPVLIENPSGSVPLAAAIRFERKEPLHTKIEISDGKISAWRDYFDLATFTNQMS